MCLSVSAKQAVYTLQGIRQRAFHTQTFNLSLCMCVCVFSICCYHFHFQLRVRLPLLFAFLGDCFNCAEKVSGVYGIPSSPCTLLPTSHSAIGLALPPPPVAPLSASCGGGGICVMHSGCSKNGGVEGGGAMGQQQHEWIICEEQMLASFQLWVSLSVCASVWRKNANTDTHWVDNCHSRASHTFIYSVPTYIIMRSRVT